MLAKAGIQISLILLISIFWTPASAGVTMCFHTASQGGIQQHIDLTGYPPYMGMTLARTYAVYGRTRPIIQRIGARYYVVI